MDELYSWTGQMFADTHVPCILQSLMYGHVDMPTDNFSWKNQSPDRDGGCENQCAFRDKVFTVEVRGFLSIFPFCLSI